MFAPLIRQFGLDTSMVLKPMAGIMLDTADQKFGVFHVADAEGSPLIPAQEDFVVPFGIKSVLGFGSLFSSGSMLAVILFSRLRLSAATANMLAPIGSSAKLALLPAMHEGIFPT
jgi:hypothetical protein